MPFPGVASANPNPEAVFCGVSLLNSGIGASDVGSGCRVVSGLRQWLKLEYGIARRQVLESLGGRSLRDREEALHLGGEAVEIRLENGRSRLGRKLAHGITAAAQGANEVDFTRNPGIASPIRIAPRTDQVAPPIELEP